MGYAIGIDYGTGSGRVLIVDLSNGTVVGKHVVHYEHGVIESALEGRPIPSTYALQNARDYIDVLTIGIPKAMAQAKILPEDIVGIGIDFTSSTMIVCDENFIPLHWNSHYRRDPHAYVKLWKHHGAVEEAQALYTAAQKNLEKHLGSYGFNVSSEWMIPKMMELMKDAPHILEDATYVMEAGDWIVSLLIGKNVRSECALGFKTFWNEEIGFDEQLLFEVDPSLPQLVLNKMRGNIVKLGDRAGRLSQEGSLLTKLPPGIAVAPAIIDAHAAVLGIGAVHNHQLTMVMGTSTCHLMLHDEHKKIPGISGSVKDGIVPGLYAYEAGQSAVGDLFATVVDNVPATYIEEARHLGLSIFDLLEKKASMKEAGETGLIALDWHNGNRSPLSNSELSGVIVGLTLHTKIEDIYRAYMEATAFGTKMIMKAYEKHGLKVETIYACGGLPQKNELLMQIYANVLQKPVHISNSDYAPAIGAAILGAVAGDVYETVEEAAAFMKQPLLKTVEPIAEDVHVYEELFSMYETFHRYLGIENRLLLEKLKRLA